MATLIEELSVFFPAYNEEANLEETVLKAKAVLEKIAGKWEIIVVNDGSKDQTLTVAKKLAEGDSRIKIVSHDKNRGYGASLKSGLYASNYSWIAFTDADGQFDFSEVSRLFDRQNQTKADIVIGYYLDRKVSLFVKLSSKLWELVVFLLFGLKVKDIDCGFKLIAKRVVEALPKLESERGAFISSEFLIKAKKKGFRIAEVGVNHYPRTKGQATGRRLNVIIKSFVDLFNLWLKLR